MTMSMVFRTIGASARSLSQALAPSAVLMLALVIFTGFVIPTRNMLGWSRWIGYIDPISYGFEALMVNEFSGQEYSCSAFVPAYPDATGLQRVCSTVGAEPGSSVVNGDAYINASFEYYASHRWRNFGIILAFAFFFLVTYLVASGTFQLQCIRLTHRIHQREEEQG
jgi:ATP-binding cassette subfamily G (WHITE) protein 2 (PDR)